jgi:ribosomal protein L17
LSSSEDDYYKDPYVREFKKQKKILKANVKEQLVRDGIIDPDLEKAEQDPEVFVLKGKDGVLIYRRDSFKKLMNNDSLKYHENGMREVYEEF